MRRFLPAALVLVVLLAAGCGSRASDPAPSGGSIPSGASVVRSGVLGFVSVDSDLGSSQWRQLDSIAKKFPGRDTLIAHLEHSFTKQGLDFDRDVKPALGPEVDVAVVGGIAASPKAVVLTKPSDPVALRALVAKANAHDAGSGERAVYREADGWYAVSYSQAAIADALVAEGTPLSDDGAFKEALGKLPADALVKAYVDGPGLDAAVRSASQKQPASGLGTSSLGLDTLMYVAASISAEHDGIRVHGASSGGSLGGGEFASKLIGSVPGDALAFLDFRAEDTAKQLDRLKASPQAGAGLEQIQATLGVPLDEVLGLLHGEVAFYVRPSVGIPELTLALQESDMRSALETLDKIASHLVKTMHAHLGAGTQDGHPVKTISFGQFAIHYGAVGDTVVITNGVNGIADFGGSGDRLPDSADFKEAKDAAGMPDSTGAVVYIDLKDALPLIEGFATLSGHGPSSEATENLRPLRSFLAWSEGGPGARTYDAFLEIK